MRRWRRENDRNEEEGRRKRSENNKIVEEGIQELRAA